MLTELKESSDKPLNKIRNMRNKQSDNINKDTETIDDQTEILELKDT
jgi:hypothetical protein